MSDYAGTAGRLLLGGFFVAGIVNLLADPEFREKEMLAKGDEPTGLGPEEFAALVAKESRQRAAMVRISGAKAD